MGGVRNRVLAVHGNVVIGQGRSGSPVRVLGSISQKDVDDEWGIELNHAI